jgi:hypothetical protein
MFDAATFGHPDNRTHLAKERGAARMTPAAKRAGANFVAMSGGKADSRVLPLDER